MSQSDPERSADFRNSPRILKDIIKIIGFVKEFMRILLSHFFYFRKSRETPLKDILKSSFNIFIKIRRCLILEEFRKYQYKSCIYSKKSRECVCDKCDNILLTEIT